MVIDANGEPWSKHFEVPWSQLCYLKTIGIAPTAELFELLSRVPNILQLTTDTASEIEGCPPAPSIRLEYLTSLDLQCWDKTAFTFVYPVSSFRH